MSNALPLLNTTKPETKAAREKRVVGMWREKLASNPVWACRGLVKVFEAQTAAEQDIGTVTELNGVGFTGTDGEFLTSLAKQYQSRGQLSPKQMTFVFKKMPKYAKQLWVASGCPG